MLNVVEKNQKNLKRNPPVIEFELVVADDVDNREDWFDTISPHPHIEAARLAYEEYTGLEDWRSLDFENKLYWFREASPLLK